MSKYREGKLGKNNINRFEVEGVELTSGDVVEVMLSDQWIRGRIEFVHAWGSYAFMTSSGLDAKHAMADVKRRGALPWDQVKKGKAQASSKKR